MKGRYISVCHLFNGNEIVGKIRECKLSLIEAHSSSARKALAMSTTDLSKIQEVFVGIGYAEEIKTRKLSLHEIDAAEATITGHEHLKQKTELIGDRIEGYIVVPTKSDWGLLKT